ncbi:DUF922 domain-containing protein [Albibacillus kandeliae]|uniref:DUF922 domain-containing protein n=1 Tax=Albibacillus kandeliae TaxID=2174228 RepID=UPI000D68ACE3|nr:DUF922 domain-containing protein [Albibacillus kandeliae]
MPASLTYASPRFATYKTKGKTLKEVWDSIVKTGPVDPNDNKHVAFLTTTEVTFDPDRASFTGDGKIKVEKRTGWFEAKCKIKSMNVILMSYVDCPNMSVSGLSKTATKEWRRFYEKARSHEMEHVKKAVAECEKMVKELNAMRGTGLGETETDARNFAIDDLKTKMFEKFGGSAMDDRLNKIHGAFDKSTKHGEKAGAKLNTSIE